jgi:hypothetical protein
VLALFDEGLSHFWKTLMVKKLKNTSPPYIIFSNKTKNARGRQLKKVKKEIFFLGLSFLLFSSFSRHSPKVDKVVFFLPRFFFTKVFVFSLCF